MNKKVKTPVLDFVNDYIKSGRSRFHMPGHKGKRFLGIEGYDITEIEGADVLYSADGIIDESESIASELFNTAHSYYCAGGSTTAIYAMLALVADKNEERTHILAARNVHKAFVNACAILDYDVSWIMGEEFSHICRCKITPKMVEEAIKNAEHKPSAIYLTSPDYLGNIQDIEEISKICKAYDVPLLVDNAHGAYLGFLEKSLHPIHLGADICCDSAHKTLPALTGAAYLHISKDAPYEYVKNARKKLSVFASSSPSYLILQSLDMVNSYLAKSIRKDLLRCIKSIDQIKGYILGKGFLVCKTEPLKIVIDALKSGYTGIELAQLLRRRKIEPEFYDNDFLVLMVSTQNKRKDFKRLKSAFSKLCAKPEIPKPVIKPPHSIKTATSIRRAVFSESESVDICKAVGRICASPTVSCPPAVPIAISGELIGEDMISLFKHYGIKKIEVIKE